MITRRASFPRSARLLRPSQFRGVFASGRKIVSDGFVVISVDNDLPSSRLGLALAKRRINRAVDRSRVKRLVRESFRHVRQNLRPSDVIVLARSRTSGLDNATLMADLERVWTELGLRR